MRFEDIDAYYETTARAWAVQFDRRHATMHPAFRDRPGISHLRSVRHLEELVLERCDELGASRVFDLGCGFASSMLYAANIRPGTIFSGICSSDTEQETARACIREAGKNQTVMAFRGDFEEASNYRVFPVQDIVYAFDSYRHVRDPAVLLGLLHRLVRPAGRLILADWFRTSQASPATAPHLEAWRSAAGISAVHSSEATVKLAVQSGFSLACDTAVHRSIVISPAARMGLLLSIPHDLVRKTAAGRVRQARRLANAAVRAGLLEYRVIELMRN
jgi:SAM-dependent methyltransferase